jgi:conjugative transfer signal peptidase TraF
MALWVGRARIPKLLYSRLGPSTCRNFFHSRAFLSLITLGSLFAAASVSGFRFNLTSSLPVGLYRVTNDPRTLQRGTIVLYCLPPSIARFAYERGYVPTGGRCAEGLVPIGKVVVALSGDTVSVTTAGITVNGRPQLHSRPLSLDRRGQELPHLLERVYVTHPDHIWLLAPSDRSFDSRYLGGLSAANVTGRLRPFWITAKTVLRDNATRSHP